MLKYKRELKKSISHVLEAANAAFDFAQGTKHEQVRVVTRTGRRFVLPIPSTPSDHRGSLNFFSGLRRQLDADATA